ncbi:MAG: TRAP transporter small permease [Rhizobiales bacterium]|nr:TRAP transporter small permease [Hyphomicrobiales bacterium]
MSKPLTQTVAPTGGNAFLRAVAFLSTLCGVASAFMILISVLITCQMIWIRFVLNQSTVWQTEMVIYLMIAATVIGLPYVQRLRGHVNVDLVPLMMAPVLRRFMAILTLSATIAIIVVMLVYSYELWHIAWSKGWRSDTVWGVKLSLPYAVMPIGFGLFLLQLIADLYAVIANIDRPFGLSDKEGL